jgi:hypothetical protein
MMKKMIKPLVISLTAFAILTACGEQSVYDKEVPFVVLKDTEGMSDAEKKELYSSKFKEVQEFVNKNMEHLSAEDADKLRTHLVMNVFAGRVKEGTTVGDILKK